MSAIFLRARFLTLLLALLPACLCLMPTHAAGRGAKSHGSSQGNPPSTTTTLSTSQNPTQFGQPVSLSAQVMGNNPTLTVTFTVTNGSTQFTQTQNVTVIQAGVSVAMFNTSSLPVGVNNIVAAYNGDQSNQPSTSNTVFQIVNKRDTSVTLTSSQNPSNVGNPVTFNAQVNIPIAGTDASGTVTFSVDGAAEAPVTVTSTNGYQATFTPPALFTGSHTITAAYSGNASFAVSSVTLTQTVRATGTAPTTTAVASSLNPSQPNQPVTFTATITPYDFDVDFNGSVTFRDGATSLGTVATPTFPLGNFNSVTLTTSTLAAGTHTITATFNGDNFGAPSTSSAVIQNVAVPLHTFPQGLQMISVPQDFSGAHLDFAGLFGLPIPLVATDPELIAYAGGAYDFYPVAPADTLRPGVGYWLNVPSAGGASILALGTPALSPFTIPLHAGWNIAGDPFDIPISLENLQVRSSGTTQGLGDAARRGILSQVFWSYEGSGYFPNYIDPRVPNQTPLVPYKGYWVYCVTDCQLLFTVPVVDQPTL